jgi:restriction system protein
MNPRQFEEFVCNYYRKQGYKAELTSYTGDCGVDVFATKGKEKLAIQAKMYGGSTRKINRQCVMELHGAKDYFDCTKAVIATDGALMPDAENVAKKLKIDIVYLTNAEIVTQSPVKSKSKTFESIWESYILPLQGKTLIKSDGETNSIVKADWSGIERVTSNGKNQKIKVEIFKWAINKLLATGTVTRDEINQNYTGRASSGIVLILAQVPFFQLTKSPTGLTYKF